MTRGVRAHFIVGVEFLYNYVKGSLEGYQSKTLLS